MDACIGPSLVTGTNKLFSPNKMEMWLQAIYSIPRMIIGRRKRELEFGAKMAVVKVLVFFVSDLQIYQLIYY